METKNNIATYMYECKHKNKAMYIPCRCDQCGEMFTVKSALNRQKAAHRKEEIFKCTECGKILPDKSALTQHMQVHSDDRPYKCDQCNKTFKHNQSFKNHLRAVHKAEHVCTVCGKMCDSEDELNGHVYYQHWKKVKCPICGQMFGMIQHYWDHLALVYEDKTVEINTTESA